MKKSTYLTAILTCLITLGWNCAPEPDPFIDQNEPLPPCLPPLFASPCARIFNHTVSVSNSPVFSGRALIKIPPYQYTNLLGGVTHVLADSSITNLKSALSGAHSCCSLYEMLDKMNISPTLEWEDSGNSLVAASIFEGFIRLSNDGSKISNVDQIVWTWNSKLQTGQKSNGKYKIAFQDGRDVDTGGKILETTTPLLKGKAYTWMVWAWNEQGTEIVASSRGIPFIVGTLQLTETLRDPRQLAKEYQLVSAIQQPGSQVIDSFPIQIILLNSFSCGPPFEIDLTFIVPFNDPTLNQVKGKLSFYPESAFVLENSLGIADPDSIKINCDKTLQIFTTFQGNKTQLTFSPYD